MSFFKISPEQIETFTLATNPTRSFSSSSAGQTGSIYVFPRHSPFEKDTNRPGTFVDTVFSDTSIDSSLKTIKYKKTVKTNIFGELNTYLNNVNSQAASSRKNKVYSIKRIVPSSSFDVSFAKKSIIKDCLFPFYRSMHSSINWGYTNYHSLNFFTASSVNTSSVLLYPNSASIASTNFCSGSYVLTGALSFDFYINPRYTTTSPNDHFKAGTILHLSSCYAVSLITGTSKDINGYPDKFRILLQLSHSADLPPSGAIINGIYPNDLVFASLDNSLLKNNWHHVQIRWGTNQINNGTGSFIIDGQPKGIFEVNSSSLAPAPFVGKGNSDMLCVGNYYTGRNASQDAFQSIFFSDNPARRDGVARLSVSASTDEPAVTKFSFDHPLNAELHDIIILNKYITDSEISSGTTYGQIEDLKNVVFYLPPFFVKESPTRRIVNSEGGYPITPFVFTNKDSNRPFNVSMSFGVSGHDINLHNFLRDFKTGNYPRLFRMTGSVKPTTPVYTTANDALYSLEGQRRKNLTILPCDDGNFIPNFNVLKSGSLTGSMSLFVDDLGIQDLSNISLNNLISSASFISSITADSGSIFESIVGPTPEQPSLTTGSILSVLQRARDNSSNEIVIFELSNLFYGNRIKPGSFSITDDNISGSAGKIKITLRDNGKGNLYRSDCFTSQSTWNSCGNIFYNEGLVCILNPHIAPLFGKDQFNISFEGEQNIHVMKINAFAPASQLNSSSNPNYQIISASNYAFEQNGEKFVYISTINFHDDNLNIIMKSVLAQPIIKRESDKYLFKISEYF